MGKRPIILIISLLCLLSCGLEDYLYIDYIPDGNITDNTFASIRLPSNSAEGYSSSSYFRRFEIYYRIYISGEGLAGIINTPEQRNLINRDLNSAFLGFYSLTDKTSTSANPSNLETVFSNRQYFKLALLEDNIDTVLGRGSLGGILDIQFWTDGSKPMLILNGVPYTLQRARSGLNSVFTPVPDLDFLNSPDLCNTSNVTNEKNADVSAPNPPTPDPRYTYVSLYIFAIGEDYITRIYSQPTHIGIFRMAPTF